MYTATDAVGSYGWGGLASNNCHNILTIRVWRQRIGLCLVVALWISFQL